MNVLLLLALPEPVRAAYLGRLRRAFPEVTVNLAEHHEKVGPYIADADVLVVLAEAAGGQPPVTKNAPPSVELVTYGKRGRMAVFVMNETTNPFENISVIRYVVPPPDIEIRVKTDVAVSSVTGVTGRPVRYEVHDQWLTVRLPKINEYEVLMVDLILK